MSGEKVRDLMAALEESLATATSVQREEGWCCWDDCCGPGSWCCAHANPHHHADDGDVIPLSRFDGSAPPE